MKTWPAFLFIIVLTLSNCVGQETTPFHPIVAQAKTESYFAPNLDWININKEFVALAKNHTTNDSLKPALTYLLNAMGDSHGVFRSATTYMPVAYFTAYESIPNRDTRERDSDFTNNVINNTAARFSYKQLNANTGYLKIVGIGPQQDVITEAQNMRAAIVSLDKLGVTNWVIDLRFNGGGNMNPMLAGMAPLLTEGVIGYSIDNQGQHFQEFVIKNGQFIDTGRIIDSTATKIHLKQPPKIAVLLSRYTVSSGELVGVAFKTQNNVRFFGEHSGGKTTATGWLNVGNDLMMCISKSVFADRTGTTYPITVPVDVLMQKQIPFYEGPDAELYDAIKWLNE